MGMAARMGRIWGEANAKYLAAQQRTSDIAGGLGAVSKVLRRHHHCEFDPGGARAGAG